VATADTTIAKQIAFTAILPKSDIEISFNVFSSALY
jgi:hypothetical protein